MVSAILYTIQHYTCYCHVILYYIIFLYYTGPEAARDGSAMLYYIMLYYTILLISYHAILYSNSFSTYTLILYYTILYYVITSDTLLYSTLPCALYYTGPEAARDGSPILYYTKLYYTIVYYTIVYYTII